MSLGANVTLPTGGWEWIQEEVAAELKLERIEVHQDGGAGLREEDTPGERHSRSNGIKVRNEVFCGENLHT